MFFGLHRNNRAAVVDNFSAPVDWYVISPALICGLARHFTCTAIVISPAAMATQANIHKPSRNRNARARL
jgi:hypothetical protein